MDTSNLAKRMKDYESVSKIKLMKRCPVCVRIDGKAHHNFTKGFKRPFDEIYVKAMQETAKYLCENIQGVVLSYQQSDEITLIMIDYKELNTSPYFDYEVQKLCSIIASMATMAFNKYFVNNISEHRYANGEEELYYSHEIASHKGAMFDARVFNIPKEEVTNLIYWRQLDATRNSIQMVGQANFSHNELQNKSCNIIQDMLMTQKGINWNDYPTHLKRGSCCIKKSFVEKEVQLNVYEGTELISSKETKVGFSSTRPHWIIDKEIPIFKGEGRKYIDDLVFVGE